MPSEQVICTRFCVHSASKVDLFRNSRVYATKVGLGILSIRSSSHSEQRRSGRHPCSSGSEKQCSSRRKRVAMLNVSSGGSRRREGQKITRLNYSARSCLCRLRLSKTKFIHCQVGQRREVGEAAQSEQPHTVFDRARGLLVHNHSPSIHRLLHVAEN